jgi:hypothetical protein
MVICDKMLWSQVTGVGHQFLETEVERRQL